MAENNGYGWTPVQQRMMDVLSDGKPHNRFDLHACLHDDLGPTSNIRRHLSDIRKKLRPNGRDILVEYVSRALHYRLVQLLPVDPKA